MKQGRTIGSYFVFLIKEGLFRLRKELFSWRGLLVLFILVIMVLDTVTVEQSGRLAFLGVAAIWLILLFPPRIGKLLYLLPFSRNERKRYLGMYAITYMGFILITFLLVGGVASFIAKYSYILWLVHFVCSTIPFLVLYSGVMLFSVVNRKPSGSLSWWFYSTRQIWDQPVDYVEGIREDCKSTVPVVVKKKKDMTPEERAARRKDYLFVIVTTVGAVVTAVQCFGYWMWPIFGANKTISFIVGTIAAYSCAIVALFVYVGRIAEELNSTGSTGKEECECNS